MSSASNKHMGDDEDLMASASKRLRLNDATRINIFAATATATEFLHNDYTVGWICAIPKEMAVGMAMLDSKHDELPRAENDTNTYALGSIGLHNIAIGCLPSGYYGNNNAATVASNMRRTFPSIRLCLMVGIAGGAPVLGKADIRLGDVVVGEGVLQHDLGKTVSGGNLMRTGHVNRPPHELLTAVAKLRASHMMGSSQIPAHLSEMLKRCPEMTKHLNCDSLQDRLFDSAYEHTESTEGLADECERCDASRLVKRRPRDHQNIEVHYGIVASGNQVVRNGKTRDKLAHDLNALCVEMEGSGVMDGFAGLVIRGICDYSDSHKNKQWQNIAAAVAAAYAKELLLAIPVDQNRAVRIIARPSANMNRQKKILASLRFDRIDARRSAIQEEHSTTCQWLLTHPDYLDWLDPKQAGQHHGFLWIRGNPGTGKSTMMKFVCKEMKKDTKKKVISFFFNARGEDLERSTFGMYRSLLFQILKALPCLYKVFDEPEHQDYLETLHTDHDFVWRIEVLQDMLRSALMDFGQTGLTIFVDALDECATDQVEELLEYFEKLGKKAALNGSQLNVCFSSRHYPHNGIQYCRNINLDCQDGHEKDIAMYVRDKLKLGEGETADNVKNSIQAKANNIFMWVFLVIRILNEENKDGRMFDIEEHLAEIPDNLSELFQRIILRDERNLRDVKLGIQWILFSKRALKLEEYYFAVVSGLRPDKLREWNADHVTTEDMSKFLISSSKGLAEVTKSDAKTVQFIHESVREFLLKDGPKLLWPSLAAADFEFESHDQLKRCCQSYLAVGTSGHIPLPLSIVSSDEVKERRHRVSAKFPFLEYATRYVLPHADAAACLIPQREFLKYFPLKVWITLSVICEIFGAERYTLNASLLYILAERNLARLIQDALSLDSRTDIKGERHRYPLFAALAFGHREAVGSLLQMETKYLDGNVNVWKWPPDRSRNIENMQTPLLWAAKTGHEAIMLSLVENGSDVNVEDEISQTPLLLAAKHGLSTVVQLLLAKGSDIEAKNGSSCTPLWSAAECSHTAIVELLLAKGANVHTRNVIGWTPLVVAARLENEAIMRLLLDNGADINTKDTMGRTPLITTALHGRCVGVRLLLDNGAIVDLKDNSGRTALIAACQSKNQNEAVMRLLLDHGADIDAKDNSGQTPLINAALFGQGRAARLLLDNGADIETKDNRGRTPLLAASQWESKNEVVMRLLLDNGADIDAKDNSGRTPLITAALFGQGRAARLLLDNGADIETKDNRGRTPLLAASQWESKNEVVMRLLLDNGADIDTKDNNGRTPLITAALYKHGAAVRLLLARGASVQVKGVENKWRQLAKLQHMGVFTAEQLQGRCWRLLIQPFRPQTDRSIDVDEVAQHLVAFYSKPYVGVFLADW